MEYEQKTVTKIVQGCGYPGCQEPATDWDCEVCHVRFCFQHFQLLKSVAGNLGNTLSRYQGGPYVRICLQCLQQSKAYQTFELSCKQVTAVAEHLENLILQAIQDLADAKKTG